MNPSGISLKRDATSSTQFAYTIGCDPELFLVDSKGEFRSAHDLVPGNKLQPFRVSKGAIQPDGTSAEFNIDSAVTADEFTANIRSVLLELQATIKEKDPGLALRVTPVAHFDEKYFATLPGEALAFGCTPDYNAWTEKQTDFKGTTQAIRTGAGHIHVGWTQFEEPGDSAHIFDCIEATKQLDAVLYPMSLLWDKDRERRTLYGKMGAFRAKPYGVEYRPLSNAWVADPDLHKWIFEATTKAMSLLDGPKYVRMWLDSDIESSLGLERTGAYLIKSELLKIHDILVEDFGFPALPSSYTKKF